MMPSLRKRACLAVVFAVASSTTARATAADATKEAAKGACIAASERAQKDRRTGKYQEAHGEIATCMDTHCPATAQSDISSLHTMQAITNVGLGVGIGGVVVGGILWLAAGHPEKAPPVTGWLGVGSAGIGGRF
jgi:hypothetical protein